MKDEIIEYLRHVQVFKDERFENCFINSLIDDYRSSPFINPKPIWFGLKITGKCNFKCKHCWASLQDIQDPSYEQIQNALLKLKRIGVLHVTISGGEPFIRNDILKIIGFAKKLGFHLSIFSNGSLISKKQIDHMKITLHAFDFIQISLDSVDVDSYSKQRSNESYHSVISTISMLKKSGILVRVNMTATQINVHTIYDTYIYLAKLGVDTFSVSYVYPLHNGEKMQANLKDGVSKFIKEVVLCLKNKSDATKFKPFIPVEYLDEISQSVCDGEITDFVLYNSFLFRSTDHLGNIYPDVTLEHENLYVGNIYNDTEEIILSNSKKIGKLLSTRSLKNSVCSKCTVADICKGGDLGRTYKRYLSINYKDPNCSR